MHIQMVEAIRAAREQTTKCTNEQHDSNVNVCACVYAHEHTMYTPVATNNRFNYDKTE